MSTTCSHSAYSEKTKTRPATRYSSSSNQVYNCPPNSPTISTIKRPNCSNAGFPADVLTEEEIDAGVVSVVGGIEQVNYILIRNHIITKWRENVFNWVTKEMFLDVVPSHCTSDKASKLRQLMGEVSQDVSLWGGFGDVLAGLAENVPILYEKTVNAIRYGSDGVQVVTSGGQVFEGDTVLCTVPLGVLKSGSIKFNPELPQRKLDGIKRLGFGCLNKVAMLFSTLFWGTDLDMFGHLSDDPNRRGEFFLFYSYATVAGGPVLMALVAGEAAYSFESMPPTDAVKRILQILRGIYEPQGIEVPEPLQTVCTRWGSDPLSLGSYSNVAVGASGDDYDILAESVGDGRLFFAGEATTRRYPATMHGAFLSGLREAANIAHYATNRALRAKVERNPSKNAHACASLLADLFRDPDLEFGSFSVIYPKKDTDEKPMAVLRVVFSGPAKKVQEGSRPDQQHSNKLIFQQLQSHFNQQQQLHVYTLLSKEQVFELREVKGGDEMRLNYLCEKLGVKLVGRKGLGPAAEQVISLIKAERSKRKPALTPSTIKSGTSKPKSGLKQRKAKILRNNGPVPPVGRDGAVKVVQLNRDVEVKVGNVESPNKSVVNGGNGSIPNVNTGGSGVVIESAPILNVDSGVINPPNIPNTHFVPTSNAQLDSEVQK
ncbi:hypothetical protein OSB04_017753 [Centaurea solstitialis]|uniref:Amine oxidase domain-containing protein n=1 Tax=Centaurea solstitialis TaxID=347529 RepID=A0AA38T3H2_9ASTR|nr:hypothetical protein OSB04_017753 [Centaurea solstitialis]